MRQNSAITVYVVAPIQIKMRNIVNVLAAILSVLVGFLLLSPSMIPWYDGNGEPKHSTYLKKIFFFKNINIRVLYTKCDRSV